MRRLFACSAVMLAFTGATLALTAPLAAQQAPSPVQPSPVKRTVLGKVEVPGANYDVITALVEIQPGFKAGRHSHPGTVQAQVLEGEFWFVLDGQPEKVAKPGEWLEIRNSAIHNEGAQGAGPAKLIAIYTVERGKPLVSPAQ
jgi:quercetin dioxygenase-like cupin family protein